MTSEEIMEQQRLAMAFCDRVLGDQWRSLSPLAIRTKIETHAAAALAASEQRGNRTFCEIQEENDDLRAQLQASEQEKEELDKDLTMAASEIDTYRGLYEVSERALQRVREHLVTARHLLKENWSGKDDWWVGNEHAWSAQADDEIRKAIALASPGSPQEKVSKDPQPSASDPPPASGALDK
jgi:hypothetical protein